MPTRRKEQDPNKPVLHQTVNAAPSLGFNLELLPSSLGQAVVFRAAVGFGLSPEGGNPTLFLHPVESGKKRA